MYSYIPEIKFKRMGCKTILEQLGIGINIDSRLCHFKNQGSEQTKTKTIYVTRFVKNGNNIWFLLKKRKQSWKYSIPV